MSKTLAVAGRELRERWLLFPAGLVLGFVPLVLPAFGFYSPDGVPAVGTLVAFLLGAVAAFVAGASMLARDTADGRIGFLFSRPVSWPAIWGGKWLAAIVLAVGCTALATLPWMVVHPASTPAGSWRGVLVDPEGSTFFLVLLLITVGLANFNATAYRSRSAWVAVDLGLLLLALWAAWSWVAPLMPLVRHDQPMPRWRFLWVLGAPALALLAASSLQVAVGRTDLRRAHRALSITFWSILFVCLAAAGLRLAWARAATPVDLRWYGGRGPQGSLAPTGRWLNTAGLSRRGGVTSFLIDTGSGDYLPLGVSPHWSEFTFQGMAFDAEGRTGALLSRKGDGSALAVADLTGAEPRFRWVPLEASPPPGGDMRLALSASGSHALLAHRHGVSLFALPSGRRVATATVPPGWRPSAVRMLGESVARVWLSTVIDNYMAGRRGEMRVLEIAVDREPRLVAFALSPPLDDRPIPPFDGARSIPDATGERILTRDGGIRLRDGATGALLATLVETEAPVATRFVADGRIVVAVGAGAQTLLQVFAADGAPLGDTVFERVPTGLSFGPEVSPGQVILSFTPLQGQPDTAIFDLQEGRVVESPPGVQPLGGFLFQPPSPGAVEPMGRTRLVREGPNVVRLDVESGERRVLAGPDARLGRRLSRRDAGLE